VFHLHKKVVHIDYGEFLSNVERIGEISLEQESSHVILHNDLEFWLQLENKQLDYWVRPASDEESDLEVNAPFLGKITKHYSQNDRQSRERLVEMLNQYTLVDDDPRVQYTLVDDDPRVAFSQVINNLIATVDEYKVDGATREDVDHAIHAARINDVPEVAIAKIVPSVFFVENADQTPLDIEVEITSIIPYQSQEVRKKHLQNVIEPYEESADALKGTAVSVEAQKEFVELLRFTTKSTRELNTLLKQTKQRSGEYLKNVRSASTGTEVDPGLVHAYMCAIRWASEMLEIQTKVLVGLREDPIGRQDTQRVGPNAGYKELDRIGGKSLKVHNKRANAKHMQQKLGQLLEKAILELDPTDGEKEKAGMAEAEQGRSYRRGAYTGDDKPAIDSPISAEDLRAFFTSAGSRLIIASVTSGGRISLGLTQQELADEADVGLRTIQKMESGKGNPTVESIEKVFAVLDR